MGKRWVLGTLMVLFALVVAGSAFADTGGSMGGGDWGGGGGGGGYSSSSSSDWSSSSSSDWSSSSNDYSSSHGWSSGGGSSSGGLALPAVIYFGIGCLVFLFWIFAEFTKNSGPSSDYSMVMSSADYLPLDAADVSVLRIAIDGRARKFVQTELKRIAASADTKTAAGRMLMLREVAILLRKLRDAWVYGGAINEPMRGMGDTKSAFDRHVDDARSRFMEETIRNADGQIMRREASEYRPRGDEGAGLILVSLIVAARRELYTVNHIGNGEDLRKALDASSQLSTGNLIAIEIVWQPSEDSDRLSSMELEAKYPRPDLIPIQGALVGKTFCTYCSGPFPAELVSCPHCGAPAPGRDAPKAA